MSLAIEVSHLTKEYRLGAMRSLGQTLRNTGSRLLGRTVDEPPPFKALDDVNFTIEQGEVVGIIGHNGAGKSTLLKMLARISTPTSGSVKVNGRIAPLIEVGAGFVPEFTGRENVYLNGSILGMPKKEIDRKFDEIVDFAEMAEFIDTPVKRYSSGMQVKLAFAVAVSVESEILIVDEVLAVGDLAFQRKCFDRMEDLIKRQGRTVLLVSHNIRQVERLCTRAILLNRGKVVDDDEPTRVCNHYYEMSDERIKSQALEAVGRTAGRGALATTSGDLHLLKITMLDESGAETDRLQYMGPAVVRATFKVNSNLSDLCFGVGAHTPDMIFVANDDSILSVEAPLTVSVGILTVEYRMDQLILLPGVYALRVGVALKASDASLFYADNLYHFQVHSDNLPRSRTVGQGFVAFAGAWRFSGAVSCSPAELESRCA